MTQILIACTVFMAALAAALHHRQVARSAATELSRLRAEQSAANSAISDAHARSAASAQRHAELSLDLTSASAELKAASELALRARTEPDPTTEGTWPTDKPYFYLPKRFLSQIGFTALTPDGTPTPEAIALLGLTPSERDDLRNAWADFRFDLQELQIQSAERMPDTNSVPDPDRRAIRFKLGSLTNELPRLREQLNARLTDAVGSTRAQFLQSPLENRLEDITTPLDDGECFITYHAERSADGTVRHWLRFDATDGSSMYQFPVANRAEDPSLSDNAGAAMSDLDFPVQPNSPLWHYRHLFGDQPLIPLP